MSKYTRAAETDDQEQAIAAVEQFVKSIGKRIDGGNTVGKHPQTVILDLIYHGGEIRVDAEGTVKIHGEEVDINEGQDWARHLIDRGWQSQLAAEPGKGEKE